MLSYGVAACLVLTVSAQMGNNMMGNMGGNMMGGNMMGNMMGNRNNMGNMNMQNMMGQNWMNQMGGGQGNMMQTMMGMMGNRGNQGMGMGMGMGGMGQGGMGQGGMGQGGMGQGGMGQGMGNMGRGNMGMGGGRQQQQGMNGVVPLMLLERLMGDGRDDRASAEEKKMMEEVMKREFMMEMAEMMMVYMSFQSKQDDFALAMTRMCTMVEAGYEAAKRNGTEPFRYTTEGDMMEIEAQLKLMSEKEQLEYAIAALNEDEGAWDEIFWRYATYSCMTGAEYMKAAVKMEAMSKGESQCDMKAGSWEDSAESDESESLDRK